MRKKHHKKLNDIFYHMEFEIFYHDFILCFQYIIYILLKRWV
jgi:hypothetical protein